MDSSSAEIASSRSARRRDWHNACTLGKTFCSTKTLWDPLVRNEELLATISQIISTAVSSTNNLEGDMVFNSDKQKLRIGESTIEYWIGGESNRSHPKKHARAEFRTSKDWLETNCIFRNSNTAK
jgi:hypothetical protein